MMFRWMGMRVVSLSGVLLLLTLVSGVSRADAWWDAKWQYRRKIAFDTTDKGANIKDGLADIAVLARLHAGNFNFDNAAKDGSDLRFVSGDDKTILKYHIEKFDPKQGIALVWVKVPKVAGAGNQDSVWLYYGNSGVPAAQEAGGTYDAAQVLVYHLNETEGTPKDATAYANHASAFGGALATPALIGNGATFKGAAGIAVKPSPSLNFSKGFSFSAWVRMEQPQRGARLFSWEQGAQALVVGIEGDRPYARVAAAGKPAANVQAPALTMKTWHHVAVAAEPGKRLVLYLDGKEAGAANLAGDPPTPSSDIALGAAFAGDLDEVEVASLARPAAWFAAAAGSQGQDGKFSAITQEETGKDSENLTIKLIKVTARTVTFDGWAVIALCTIMLLLSAAVFVNKFMRLQKMKKANELFLESFNQLHDPLEMEQDNDEFEESNLYRIYQAGYDRIANWAEKHVSQVERVMLNSTAMNIFRAALDRSNSDEVKKMNSWLIVMTLGISGGPFLGLLGTVWGVMNTFASLAESGEANLSAIAPGVASALACTLFGLFVAIPSLFAYSFLVQRMKNLNNETRHFMEEYALRVEGFHGEEAA